VRELPLSESTQLVLSVEGRGGSVSFCQLRGGADLSVGSGETCQVERGRPFRSLTQPNPFSPARPIGAVQVSRLLSSNSIISGAPMWHCAAVAARCQAVSGGRGRATAAGIELTRRPSPARA
jgi:hypothetical protein